VNVQRGVCEEGFLQKGKENAARRWPAKGDGNHLRPAERMEGQQGDAPRKLTPRSDPTLNLAERGGNWLDFTREAAPGQA